MAKLRVVLVMPGVVDRSGPVLLDAIARVEASADAAVATDRVADNATMVRRLSELRLILRMLNIDLPDP